MYLQYFVAAFCKQDEVNNIYSALKKFIFETKVEAHLQDYGRELSCQISLTVVVMK